MRHVRFKGKGQQIIGSHSSDEDTPDEEVCACEMDRQPTLKISAGHLCTTTNDLRDATIQRPISEDEGDAAPCSINTILMKPH